MILKPNHMIIVHSENNNFSLVTKLNEHLEIHPFLNVSYIFLDNFMCHILIGLYFEGKKLKFKFGI